MARRTKRRIDWNWLRSITETSLNDSGRFAGRVNVDGKMEWVESGLYHDNYRFKITGTDLQKDWKEKTLMLRIRSQKSPFRSADEAGSYLSREAKTLQQLKNAGFGFQTPELICAVNVDSVHPVGLIETWIRGIPLTLYKGSIYHDRIIPTIAEAAVSVHQLDTGQFDHLEAFGNSKAHILNELSRLAPEIFKEYSAALRVKEWILSRLPENRPSVVLHGDLLPQNILCHESSEGWQVALIDWEFAEIGDPASDLAIVTRGDRKLMGIPNGLDLLLKSYRRAGGIEFSTSDVRIHELLLGLNWLQESAEAEKKGRRHGHGPEYYEQRLTSLLRRAKKSK
ncbi:MAG: aminoglycoside phosphotransferase family protein [Desulfobacterales bacterium]|jgi:aminoglycoside phosphotransferase (APT) family kinase protein